SRRASSPSISHGANGPPMKESIRNRAKDLGFDDCRFTTANPPASVSHFQQWLAQNHHGEMAYMERNARKRAHPEHILAGAKTLVMLAVSYAQEENNASEVSPPDTGILARYSRFADYHHVLGQCLKQLTEFIN